MEPVYCLSRCVTKISQKRPPGALKFNGLSDWKTSFCHDPWPPINSVLIVFCHDFNESVTGLLSVGVTEHRIDNHYTA